MTSRVRRVGSHWERGLAPLEDSAYPLQLTAPLTGFTLVETILYVGIVGAAATSFVLFILAVGNTRAKTAAAAEVQANTRVAVAIIAQRLRAATGVNVGQSVFDVSPGRLSLSMADGAEDPTIIDVDQGVLRMMVGSGSPVAMTSAAVEVTNIVFRNLTAPGTRENVQVELTVASRGSGTNPAAGYSQRVRTAVSIRQ